MGLFISLMLILTNIGHSVINGNPYQHDYVGGVSRLAIVKLTLSDGGYCTGFYIRPGVIMTAAHCINLGARLLGVRTLGRCVDKNKDTGHLHVDKSGASFLRLASVPSRAGDYVFMFGYGRDVLRYGFGYISEYQWGQYLSVSPANSVYGALERGDSGGPLVTLSGHVIGVASKGLLNGGLNYSSFSCVLSY